MLFLLNPKFRIWIKITAISITVCFIFPYLTWAFDPGSYMPAHAPGLVKVQHLDRIVSLPKKLGAITKGFQGNGRMIVHIQDLHCNYDVQMNIARIIHLLAKNHGLRLVGEEGAFHTVNTAKIRTFPMKKVRQEVSDYFVKQGKLTGAEYYSGVGEHPILLEGIETPALYKASEQSVHSFLNYESQGYCYDLREIFDELKASIYNPLLQKFDAQCLAYREGDMDQLEYCAYLRTTAQRLKLDLSPCPNLARFLSLDQKYFSEEINPDQLFRELDALDTVIRGSLYTSDLQIELDDLYRRLDIIEKLLNISATPGDLQEFLDRRANFAVRVFVEFIHRQDKTREYNLDPEVYVLDEYLNEVDKFYRLADERSIHFAANLLKKMDRFDEKLAIMITGGFHTDKILQELEAKGISYVSIKPCLIRRDIINPYFSLLQNKKMPLEKFLSQKQDIMAVLTSCPDVRNFNTSEVVPLSEISTRSQRMFNKMLGILFHNVAIVTLRKRGNKIPEIPVNLDKIRNRYPAKHDSLTMDTASFIRVNDDISNQFKDQTPPFLFIPLQDGNNKFNFMAAHNPEQLGVSPDAILTSDQMMKINGSEYYFYSTSNLSELVKAMIKNRHSPMLIMLPPEMRWWAMFGFHGLLTHLAWEMAKEGRVFTILASVRKSLAQIGPGVSESISQAFTTRTSVVAMTKVEKGVIPGVRKLLVDKRGINPRLYDNLIAPLWEEGVFTGVPIILGMICPLLFIPVLLGFRLAFIALHLTGARAPDGTWNKKKLVSWLALPLLISAVVALAAFNLAFPMLFALAIGKHILTNTLLQPLINRILEKLGIKLRLLKAAITEPEFESDQSQPWYIYDTVMRKSIIADLQKRRGFIEKDEFTSLNQEVQDI
ncbi:hypothetical protein KAR10_01515, partial [bacterium]|nr:hypothetical protein [bacterium]